MMLKTEAAYASGNAPKYSLETAVALAGTAFIALFLFLVTLNAGPLWRDETNSINLANMGSMKEFWAHLPFESFPALWVLLLRGYSLLGLAGSDAGIRMLGFFIGLGFLGSLWCAARCFKARGPVLSVALLGSLPSFFFTVESNRAYGLALCFMVLSFAAIWRVIESPTTKRILVAGVASVLFLHCVYYDAIFLCAMLLGAALVLARHRQWRPLVILTVVSALAGSTMAIYLPVVRKVSPYASMVQVPFDLALLWQKLQDAFGPCSTSQPGQRSSFETCAWIAMILSGLLAGLGLQFRKLVPLESKVLPTATPASDSIIRQKDLGLYGLVTIACGTAGYICFLLMMKFPTEPWYYLGMLCLSAISLDAVLGASWPELRPWGFLRVGIAAVLLVFGAKSVWDESQTRRTDVDLIADVLSQKADNGDLIVVQGAWEALTLDRYYHGPCRWLSVPPISAHNVHRTDLMWEMMKSEEAMKPVLDEIDATLKHNKSIWVVGYLAAGKPIPRTQLSGHRWLGEYIWNWISELTSHLSQTALEMKIVAVPVDRPVSRFENLPLMRFSGFADTEKARLDSALTKH